MPLTSLIGRDEEVDAVLQRLAGTRLLTLTGPGGVGKTRLALAVAARALPDFLDGAALLARVPSVALFVERAREALADFALTGESAAAIAQICQRLDGLPLALELAAARVRLLPPAALLARLDHGLAVLTGRRRDAPARQQTLRDTIQWSYNLLRPAEQRLLRTLSVFVGGWTLEAIESVLRVEGIPDPDVLDGLETLIESSLVQSLLDHGDGPRFRMLETIRAFASEQLAASGEADRVRRQHAAYFLDLAEMAELHLWGAEQRTWLDRLAVEHDNLRAALAWYGAAADGDLPGLRLASALRTFWRLRGHLNEGLAWLEASLGHAHPGADDAARSGARVKALNATAKLASDRGDRSRAYERYREALALAEAIEDRAGIAESLRGLGTLANLEEDWARAREFLEASLRIARGADEPSELFWSLMDLARQARDAEEIARAMPLLDEALALGRAHGDRVGVNAVLTHMAAVAVMQRDLARAQALYEEALAGAREIGSVPIIQHRQMLLGGPLSTRGDTERATSMLGEALTLAVSQGRLMHVPACLDGLAGVAVVRQEWQRAAQLFGAGVAATEASGFTRRGEYTANYERAIAATRRGLGDDAFAVAYEEGRALPLDEAVRLALDDMAHT